MGHVLVQRERRAFPRYSVHDPVLVKSPLRAPNGVTGTSENLSAGGIFLTLDSPLEDGCPDGCPVELLFNMPTQAGSGHYPVRCLGKVVWSENFSGRHGVAVAFEKVDVIAEAARQA